MKRNHATFQTVIIASLMIALQWVGATVAKAELKPKFDKLQLYNTISTMPVIEVEAEDKSWTKVSTQTLKVTTSYYASLKKGKLISIIALYKNYPVSKVRHTSGKWRKGNFLFELPASQFGTIEHYAINACNQKKKDGARTDQTHTAYIGLPFELFVRAERVGNQATKTVQGQIQAKVVCKKAPKLVEITHLNLKYDKSTNKCPINGVVEVGFNTNRNDKIHFTLGHMSRGLHKTEHTVQPFMIDGQYVATKRIDLTIDKNTEYVSIRLKDGDGYKRWSATGLKRIKCPPQKILSVWLTHKIQKPGYCPGKFDREVRVTTNSPDPIRYEIISSAGNVAYSGEKGGGVPTLEGNQYVYRSKSAATYNEPLDLELMAKIEGHNANSGWMKLKTDCVGTEKITLAFLDFKADQCPRGAQAIAQIEADTEGPIAYQLDCASAVKNWSFSGIAEAKASKGKIYAGLGHRLDIEKNQLVACALKRKTINGLKIIALKGHKFQCVSKNPEIGEGPGDFQNDKPDTHHEVKEPVGDLTIHQPQCRKVWKKKCGLKPVKHCKKVVSKDCKRIPVKKCKVKKKKTCKRVPQRVCKKVRGNLVCKTKLKKKCEVVKDKVCKTEMKSKCNRRVDTKCNVKMKKTCKKVPIRICRR